MQRALLGLARADGWAAKGKYVAVLGLDAAFTTAFVTLDVPQTIVATATDARRYIGTVHQALVNAYRDRNLLLPQWRSWRALARNWPFLVDDGPNADAQTLQSRPYPKRKVYCIKPL